MASSVHAAFCALAAAAFCSVLGYALTRRLFPRALAPGMAPVLGWAVYSAASLPILELTGFSRAAVIAIALLSVAAAAASLMALPATTDPSPAPPVTAYIAAALLALIPAAAILPKFSGDAVYLADPIFDHSKIAVIDAMTRQGLPPINPIFGEFGAPGHLAYYYLWHFSAAQLALPFGFSGWEADIGLTWFTAFASLTLLMAVAVWLSEHRRAAYLVVLLAAAASMRSMLGWIFDSPDLSPFLAYPSGFAGWLFQSAWVPQHLMAASCVVAAMLLVVRCAHRPNLLTLATLVLTVTAGFESSTYVGGVTFALGALAAAPFLLARIAPERRLFFIGAMAAAAALVLVIAVPFVVAQLATVAARHDPAPVVLRHFEVLGDLFPPRLGRLLDLPAYWLIELPLEFPATFVAGAIALALALRGKIAAEKKLAVAALACLAGAGLTASWLLASTLGDNNDLALRAVLPAALILIAATASAMVSSPRRRLIAALALGGLVLGLPGAWEIASSDIAGNPVPDAAIFAQTPELWAAVRRHAGTADRVANNPLFLQDLTPWPVNMSWALLANRSSCFAGRELALAFAPLPAARREAINEQFIRIFAGEGTPADIGDLARVFGCQVVVVVPQDKIWTSDPFASSPDYRLAEIREGRWRIYVRTATAAH